MGTAISIIVILVAAVVVAGAFIWITGGQIHHGDKRIFGRGPDNGPLA